MASPLLDALRQFDILLACALACLLVVEIVWMLTHKPWESGWMLAMLTFFFFNLSTGQTSFNRMGNEEDVMVVVRILGHAMAILFVLVLWSIRYDKAKEARLL